MLRAPYKCEHCQEAGRGCPSPLSSEVVGTTDVECGICCPMIKTRVGPNGRGHPRQAARPTPTPNFTDKETETQEVDKPALKSHTLC